MKKGVEKDVDAVLISLQRVFTVLICIWLENWDRSILLASMLCLKEEQWRKEIFWYFSLFVRIDFFLEKEKAFPFAFEKNLYSRFFVFSAEKFFSLKALFLSQKEIFFFKRSPLQKAKNFVYIETTQKTLIYLLQSPKLSTG